MCISPPQESHIEGTTLACPSSVCYFSSLCEFYAAGIIRRQEGTRSNFPALKRALRLLVEGTDDAPPDDIAYTYSGYAPLSVRLVEQAVKPGSSWAQVRGIVECDGG